MYKKNRGFTLIECIVYMFLSVLIMAMGFKLLVTVTNVFFDTVNMGLDLNSINEGFLDIDRFLRDNKVQKIESDENKLVIYKGDNKNICEIQEISKLDNNLVIKYFDIRNLSKYTTRNTIVSNISDFKVKTKGKIIYLTVKKGGNEYKRCI